MIETNQSVFEFRLIDPWIVLRGMENNMATVVPAVDWKIEWYNLNDDGCSSLQTVPFIEFKKFGAELELLDPGWIRCLLHAPSSLIKHKIIGP